MRAGAPPALQRGGKAKDYETTKQKVDELLKRSDAMLEEDYVLEIVPSTVAARKMGLNCFYGPPISSISCIQSRIQQGDSSMQRTINTLELVFIFVHLAVTEDLPTDLFHIRK
jgi:hypothetical protein